MHNLVAVHHAVWVYVVGPQNKVHQGDALGTGSVDHP